MTEKIVRATREDRKVALNEVFLVATLASLEVDDTAPTDAFEQACATDPVLQELKGQYKAFLLGNYVTAQARRSAYVREITARERELRQEHTQAAIDAVPDEIDYGPTRPLPGSGADTPPSLEAFFDK